MPDYLPVEVLQVYFQTGFLHHDGHLCLDAAGMAAQELADAAKYCADCSQQKSNSQAVWKLTGDVHLQFHATTPMQHVSHPFPFPYLGHLHLQLPPATSGNMHL